MRAHTRKLLVGIINPKMPYIWRYRAYISYIDLLAAIYLMTLRIFLIIIVFPVYAFGQTEFKLTIDPKRKYKIENADILVEYWGDTLKVTSDLNLTNWSDMVNMRQLRFSEGKLENDTVKILVFETNTIYDYEYNLKIFKDKFTIDFWYQTTIDTARRKIETVEGKLTLKSIKTTTGAELIGYTEYRGKCVEYCYKEDEYYTISGTFKVRLR
jgi:hypothetical protein